MNSTRSKIFIVDSDILIALFNKDDANFPKAQDLLRRVYEHGARLIYPSTTIVETIDTLQRKLKKYEIVNQIIQFITEAELTTESVEAIDGEHLKEAIGIFQSSGSRRKTLADAIVAAVAKKYRAEAILSFDDWYEKLGFKLASKLV